jgi:hypothetical protein
MTRQVFRMLAQTATLAILATTAACGSDSTPAAASGTALIGDACPNGTSDCGPGLECAGEDPGGGQCEKPCRPSMDADCGDTSKYVCNFEGHCYVRCTATTDCKRASQGYVCRADSPPRPPVMFCDVP